MPYSRERAVYESQLAVAHRALWRASEAASEMRDEGAEHDVVQVIKEVTRLAQASLKGKIKTPMRGQPHLPV